MQFIIYANNDADFVYSYIYNHFYTHKYPYTNQNTETNTYSKIYQHSYSDTRTRHKCSIPASRSSSHGSPACIHG
jgi:hypothetical protein